LAPGETATVAIIAANRAQARSIFKYVSGLLKAVPVLAAMVQAETADTIELSNSVTIEITTASFRTTRGYTFAAVLCDETAFWRSDETSANPDVEILRALRPGLASIPNSLLISASSPYAKRGSLYATFRKHYGKDGSRVLVWKAGTATMNPRIDPAVISEAYESDPEAARAEYGGEFRDDLADYITREAVDAVTAWGRSELLPEPNVSYSAFCDPSGGVSDAMTLAIGHLQNGHLCVLDALLEIRPPFDPEHAVAMCADVLRRFGIARVVGDRYAGEWPKARFREHGIAFEQSARPKSELYLDLLPLLNAKRVELLDNPRLSAQLTGLERRTARSGRDTVDHSPGGHDDLCNSVAGVLVGLDLDRRPALVRASDLLIDGEALPAGGAAPDCVFAVCAADERGMLATVYCARTRRDGVPLTILDFDVAPLSGGLFAGIVERAKALAATTRAWHGLLAVYAPDELIQQFERAGWQPYRIPAEWSDPDAVGLEAAGHVAAGSVKISREVQEKARVNAFGAALEFRTGGDRTDPLQVAALTAIVLALAE
jgi:hypothetical protein